MAFAIIRAGGKQFRVEQGATVRVPSLKQDVGASVELEVLATTDDKESRLGTPSVEGARVTATIVDHGRAPKIIVFKKKRRHNYRRKNGHRQHQTVLRITEIRAG